MAYQKAKCIELHDAHTALSIKGEGYSETCPIGRTDEPWKPAFRINLADLGMIFKMLGNKVFEKVEIPSGSDQFSQEEGIAPTHSVDLPIYKSYVDEPVQDNYYIETIECEVISQNLVNIRTITCWDNAGKTERVTETMTYSGTFTIWWEPEPSEYTPA